MEIERINENTIKFYISYVDIEDRGFEREEIWYDRERSEQLFWQMMEEVNVKEDFTIEGPLWIQVQALEKGLEIMVTRSQLSQDEIAHGLLDDSEMIDLPVEERIEKILESKFGRSKEIASKKEEEVEEQTRELAITFKFDEFEDVIQLSHYLHDTVDDAEISLYSYRSKYYLFVKFPEGASGVEEHWNVASQILEYGSKSKVSIHVLQEYGKVIFKEDALSQVKSLFIP